MPLDPFGFNSGAQCNTGAELPNMGFNAGSECSSGAELPSLGFNSRNTGCYTPCVHQHPIDGIGGWSVYAADSAAWNGKLPQWDGSQFVPVASTGIGYITSILDTTTINLDVTAQVLSANVIADSLTNTHINSAAAISFSKLATLATGSILVGVAGVATTFAIGAANTILGVNAAGTTLEYKTPTTLFTGTQGDIIYFSAANTIANLAKNTTATRYLSNTGASNNPAWAQIDLSNGVTGLLPLTNGGSNKNMTAVNGGVVWTDANSMEVSVAGSAGQVLQSNGAAAPTWSTPTYPSASGTVGKILRSDGTNNVYTTATFADTYGVSTILYAGSANAVSGLATANTSALVTSAGGVPSWASGATASTVLRTDGITVAFGKVVVTTDITGIVPPANGGTGIANNAASTIAISGSFATTFVTTGAFSYTLPTATATLLANNLGLAANTTLVGGTGASGTLTLSSTSNATKGSILFGNSSYAESTDYFSFRKNITTNGGSYPNINILGDMRRSNATTIGIEFEISERSSLNLDGVGIFSNSAAGYFHIGVKSGSTYYPAFWISQSITPLVAIGWAAAGVNWAQPATFDTGFYCNIYQGVQFKGAGSALKTMTSNSGIYCLSSGFTTANGGSGVEGDVFIHSRTNGSFIHIVTGSSATIRTTWNAVGYMGVGKLDASGNPLTALLHLGAGATTYAPKRYTSGSLCTGGAILAGNVEFLTDDWYGTQTTGTTRKIFAFVPASSADLAGGSRVKNTQYTNTSTRSIMVVATFRCAILAAAGVATAQGKSPSGTVKSGIVGIQGGLLGEDNTFELTFIVAAGATYQIDTAETVAVSTVTLGSWFEYTF